MRWMFWVALFFCPTERERRGVRSVAKRNLQFQTIRTEGAILPPDILRRIASLKVDGATPDAYHLPPGTKINEAISQSWTALLQHWRGFQEARAKLGEGGETGTAVTNERWLLPLFTALGYGRLVTTKSPVIDERSYPIERFYNHTPIHLIGCQLPLDRRTRGARGAATASPHSMVQEFLNCSDDHVWAFLSNGLLLRILRDNVSLSRQTFVEFDLEAMMEGEVYADFALLWLLCHQSRVESDKPDDCWLEKWSKLAREQGTRVLKDLRVGVARAIEALGRGFIGHPRNDRLCEKLHTGSLSKEDYYRQLLRIVYRLLFLFVAEDRELLHAPDASKEACDLYDTHYSTRRLRELALKMRGTKHADLWHALSLVFDALGKSEGCTQLGLSGLGSFLWRASSTADLLGPHQTNTESVFITNDDLLQAVRALAYVEQDHVLRIVDYRNLGSEELGSVYESLLELHPVMDVDGKAFDLLTAAGNERKLTGSYYTPDSLVQCLLDSALDPVVEDRLEEKKGGEAEKAILNLKVCDPASGSGHFLIAAAHRLARHLARVRTGESEPSPEDYQHALRDVIGRCVYGVDINPMAVELCKVSLWMEALEPGKPLSFLDHHIQCGNSLLGTTPALLAKGIPDEAFNPIEGDVKAICAELKRDNKKQRQESGRGQNYLFAPPIKLGNLPTAMAQIELADDDSLEHVDAKREMYERIVKGADYLNARLLADTWCAAFVWKKDNTALGKLCPTERDFRAIENNPHSILPHVKEEVRSLARQYQLFHWHLAYPDVFRLPCGEEQRENAHIGLTGGFDLVLGNPPWDKLTPDSKEFFSQFNPDVRFANRASERALVTDLLLDESIQKRWTHHRRTRFSTVKFIKVSGAFRLFAPGNLGKGDFNSYRMFVELALRLVSQHGIAAQLAPEGLYNGANAMAIRKELFDHFRLKALLGFENTHEVWFEGVHTSAKFCIYVAQAGASTAEFPAAFNIRSVERLSIVVGGQHLTVPVGLVVEFSPDALSLLEFRSQFDIDIASRMYGCWPKLGDKSAGPPLHSQSREIDMTNDATLFRDDGDGDSLPLFEGRMIAPYDYRAKAYVSGRARAAVWEDLPFGDAKKRIRPQWWIRRDEAPKKNTKRIGRYRIGYGWVSSPTNERSLIAALLPPNSIAGNAVPTIMYPRESDWMYIAWLAVANSVTMDFLVRMKVSLNLTFTLLRSLPFPRFTEPTAVIRSLAPLVLELSCTGPEMVDFWKSMAEKGIVATAPTEEKASGATDMEERLVLRSLIDAMVAKHLFGLAREQLEYIFGTFPIVEEKERRAYGEFRSKQLALNCFDRLCGGEDAKEILEAMRASQAARTADSHDFQTLPRRW